MGVEDVKFWHPFEAEPAFVWRVIYNLDGVLLDEKPVGVRGVLLVLENVLEFIELGCGVIENAIEDDFDVVGLEGFDEGFEFLVGSERGVDCVVVYRFVSVIGFAFENRVKVDGGDAEFLEVGDVLLDSGGVATHEVLVGGGFVPRRYVLGVVGFVSVGESIGEDLVENGLFWPRGDLDGAVCGGIKCDWGIGVESVLADGDGFGAVS